MDTMPHCSSAFLCYIPLRYLPFDPILNNETLNSIQLVVLNYIQNWIYYSIEDKLVCEYKISIIEQLVWFGKKYRHFSIFVCRYFVLTINICFLIKLIKIIYLFFVNKLKFRGILTVRLYLHCGFLCKLYLWKHNQ